MSSKQWLALLIFYLLYLLMGAVVFLFMEASNELENLKKLHHYQRQLTLVASSVGDPSVRKELFNSITDLERHIGKSLLPESYEKLLATYIASFKEERVHRNLHQSFNLSSSWTTATTTTTFSTTEAINTLGTPKSLLQENISLSTEFMKDIHFNETRDSSDPMWTLWNSFFFAFTALTTIGFGHMSPRTDAGQMFCVIYSLLGVPVNGILFAGLADLFASKFLNRVDSKRYLNKNKIILDAIFYLVPGLVMFFVLPAVIFMHIEGWTFLSSIYFTFITLSTIGFGDMVSGYPNASGTWLWPYRFFILSWIIFGLGYLLMVITFIQNALRSEQVRKFNRKMARVLKRAKSNKTNQRSGTVHKDLEKLAKIIHTISNINGERVFNVKDDEKVKSSSASHSKQVIPKEGYRKLPEFILTKPQVSMPTKPKKNSIDIFLELAETVLLEKEKETSKGKRKSMSDEKGDEKRADFGFGNNSLKRPESGSLPKKQYDEEMGIDNLAYYADECNKTELSKKESIIRRISSMLSLDGGKYNEKPAVSSSNSYPEILGADSVVYNNEEPYKAETSKKDSIIHRISSMLSLDGHKSCEGESEEKDDSVSTCDEESPDGSDDEDIGIDDFGELIGEVEKLLEKGINAEANIVEEVEELEEYEEDEEVEEVEVVEEAYEMENPQSTPSDQSPKWAVSAESPIITPRNDLEQFREETICRSARRSPRRSSLPLSKSKRRRHNSLTLN